MSTPNNGKQVGNYVLEMLVKHVGGVHCEIMQTNTSTTVVFIPTLTKEITAVIFFPLDKDNLR